MKQEIRNYVGVIGASSCGEREWTLAFETGKLIAAQGWILVCGGMGGVMEAACRGAFELGGTTIGILPGGFHGEGNPYLTFEIVTGLSEMRNNIVVRSSNAIIAISGGYGTLSELALAGIAGIPVIGLHTWDVDAEKNSGYSLLYAKAGSPGEAVEIVKKALGLSAE